MIESGIVIHQFLKFSTFCMLHGQLQASNPCFQIQYILLDCHKLLENGSVTFHFLMLCQTADGLSFGDDDLAVISCQFPHDDLQEGGFTSAIDSYNSGFFPFFYMKRCIL